MIDGDVHRDTKEETTRIVDGALRVERENAQPGFLHEIGRRRGAAHLPQQELLQILTWG